MKNQTLAVAVCLIIASLGYQSFSQQQYTGLIKGKIVDEKGREVSGATVSIIGPDYPTNALCKLSENQASGYVDGRFWHSDRCTVAERTLLLFVAQFRKFADTQIPIQPPYWPQLRKNDVRFAGFPVKLSGNQELDIGSIAVPVWFNKVELFVKNHRDTPYFETEDDWSKFILIIRDRKDDAVGSEVLSTNDLRHSVRLDRGSVDLVLPEGTWTLELLSAWDDFDMKTAATKRYLARTSVTVKKDDVCLQATLTVPSGRK